MQYNDLVLFAFGFGGVMIHNLTKISELQKAGNFEFRKYYASEWAAILISLILVFLAIIGKHEVVSLDHASKWLGLAYMAIGYMGQSLFVKLMTLINKKSDKLLGNSEPNQQAPTPDKVSDINIKIKQ